jgi:hypothetical protein
MDDSWKTLLGVPPCGASSNIQEEEEPHEEDGSRHLLWHGGGMYGVDSTALSLQIDT